MGKLEYLHAGCLCRLRCVTVSHSLTFCSYTLLVIPNTGPIYSSAFIHLILFSETARLPMERTPPNVLSTCHKLRIERAIVNSGTTNRWQRYVNNIRVISKSPVQTLRRLLVLQEGVQTEQANVTLYLLLPKKSAVCNQLAVNSIRRFLISKPQPPCHGPTIQESMISISIRSMYFFLVVHVVSHVPHHLDSYIG